MSAQGTSKGRGSATKSERRVLAQNRRARHDYLLLETFDAGIALKGPEVKSARAGRVQLKEAYIEVREGEAWLVGAHFSPYTHAARENPDPERPRKLLLKRRELDRLHGAVQIKGKTLVPLTLYVNGSWIKLELALAEGKKLYDKRRSEREKQLEKEARDAMGQVRRIR